MFDEVVTELTGPFRTCFLPHLHQLGASNGYRSLVQSCVVDVADEVLLLYSGIIGLWEIDSCSHQLSTQTQLAVYTEVGSRPRVECLGLLPLALGKPKSSPEGSLVSGGDSRRMHPGFGGDCTVNGSQYLCCFSGNPSSHVPHNTASLLFNAGDSVLGHSLRF